MLIGIKKWLENYLGNKYRKKKMHSMGVYMLGLVVGAGIGVVYVYNKQGIFRTFIGENIENKK
jgi:hypothetical protein